MNKLQPKESLQLKKLESVIKSGKKAFIEVGLALAEIQHSKLYREKHSTFEDYCDKVWGWSKQHAYRLIEAAPVAKSNLSVTNLEQAKALSKVPPPRRAEVMQAVVKSGSVTAKAIKAASPPPRPSADKKPANVILDGTGLPIPVEIQNFWFESDKISELLESISKLKKILKRAKDDGDIMFVELNLSTDIALLNQLYLDVELAVPHAVCPSCQGKVVKDCPTCKERGFVSEFYWKHNVSEDLKKVTGRK